MTYSAGSDPRILRQLVWIKWSTIAIAFAFVAIAGSVAWFTVRVNEQLGAESSKTSFSDKSSELLEQGKELEVLTLAESRERDFPKDVNVYWFRGRALYQLGRFDEALVAFSKAEELVPSWRVAYTEPYISSIKLKLGAGSTKNESTGSTSRPSR